MLKILFCFIVKYMQNKIISYHASVQQFFTQDNKIWLEHLWENLAMALLVIFVIFLHFDILSPEIDNITEQTHMIMESTLYLLN